MGYLVVFLTYSNGNNSFITDNVAIWELPNDYYLHNPIVPRLLAPIDTATSTQRPLTQWCSPFVLSHLPHSTSDATKIVKQLFYVGSPDLEVIDYYSNYYVPYRWTPFDEHIALQIAHRARSFMPTYRTNFSPFQPGRRREGRATNNPSMTGQSSTASATSTSSSSSSAGSDDDEDEASAEGQAGLWLGGEQLDGSGGGMRRVSTAVVVAEEKRCVRFAELLPSMREWYGCEVHDPNDEDLRVYKRYVQMGKAQRRRGSDEVIKAAKVTAVSELRPMGNYGYDCYEKVQEPHVSDEAMAVYAAYVAWPDAIGAKMSTALGSSVRDAKLLRAYAAMGRGGV